MIRYNNNNNNNHNRRTTMMTMMIIPSKLLLLFVLVLSIQYHVLPVINGFAYAPNFITKIIEEQTSIQPIGLSNIPSSSSKDNNNDNDNNNQQQQPIPIPTTVATLERPNDDNDTTSLLLPKKPFGIIPSSSSSSSSIVKTRFPPEPNGYLHLGHAKAVSFNFAVARAFGGVCHMRMDDTNPSKEDIEYVNSILEDVIWIQNNLYDISQQKYPWDGPVRKTSDYFNLIYDCAMALIQNGDAYVDSISAEQMKEYRGTLTEPGIDSPYRIRTIEENIQLFQDMKNGIYKDGEHVVRAKIDMSSPNINMRDPTLYRIKHESHQETGNEWCIYPMYDFSHPIADSIENITYSLCTLEFEDHRPFYDWTIEKLIALGYLQTRSQQIEFSRLNIKSTVLSKRKLIQLVTEQYVSGWDDPRMPTLCGIRRRGVPPEALRLFCERIGISKADSNIDYSVLETCIRDVMDNTCPRAFCIIAPLKITITNYENGNELENLIVPNHPKRTELGDRTIPFSNTVYIERDDYFDTNGPEGQLSGGKPPKGFKRLLDGGKVRLRYAYVIECHNVIRDPISNEPIELQCIYYPDTKAGVTPAGMERVNGIIHWVEATTAVPITINQYDRLFTTDEPGKDSGGNFLLDINPNSLQVIENCAVVEPSVGNDAKTILNKIQTTSTDPNYDGPKLYPSELAYQFERNGYFALDKASSTTTREGETSNIIFNRVVTLRDTWGTTTTDSTKQEKAPKTKAPVNGSERSRGTSRSDSPNGSSSSNNSNEPIEDVRRIAFRAATIVTAEPHPEAESLLVCSVDCGDDDGALRTVVAGLANKIPIEQLIGQKVVTVTNLKPAKVRGIESTAMLLAASTNDNDNEIVELLRVPATVPNGELLYFEGKEISIPDTMLKSKGAIKAWERVKEGLRTNENGEASYYDSTTQVSYRLLSSAGPLTTSTLKNTILQ